jgi:molybdopterin-guanine dinucleotide biosynthesis adapter protein
MKVVGMAGFSGSGKTTLIEHLIPLLRSRGQRVSVVKDARHGFDMDIPGKDTYRHREAGALEVVVASNERLALLREFEAAHELTVHQLIAELYDGVDWVLVEGFREADLIKIEIWRAATGKPVRYTTDDFIAAIATDSPDALPTPTGLPVLDLNDPQAVANWLLTQSERLTYNPELYR